MNKKTWFITGCSKGIGKLLVKKLLELGHNVCATSRKKDELIELFGNESKTFLPLKVDLNIDLEIKKAIDLCINHFGTIDVLVNNAGFLRSGAVEEVSDFELRESFNINLFAYFSTIRYVLSHMRKQKSGHIFNTSSIAGTIANALGSTYSGAKFAINALSYALANEVSFFNIKVTNLVLGYFNTDFLDPISYKLSYKNGPYERLNSKHLDNIVKRNHKQIGDPTKAVDLYIKLSEMENPPFEIALGSDAYEILKENYTKKLSSLEEYKDLTFSTDSEKET